ncbi:helix-turn-helix domain-containing protein [Vannielia litorea]|nr:helix-turn-helix domain-containing protein [Vannielia litorea]
MMRRLSPSEDKFLTEKELADRWKVDRRTLQRWRAAGKLPFHRTIGGGVRYALSDVSMAETSRRSVD